MKTIPYFIVVLLMAVSCQDKPVDLQQSNAIIEEIHSRDYGTQTDSIYHELKKVDQLLNSFDQLSDSLRVLNDYKLGDYFSQQGRLDSSSHYYFRAISYIDEKINPSDSLRSLIFYNAWLVC